MQESKLVLLGASAGLVLGFVLAASMPVGAQARIEIPGVEQQLLLNAPLAQFPGKQVTVFIGAFEPGAGTPMHLHPATEIIYVLEGEGVMNIRGRESKELATGKALMVEPHTGQDSFVHQVVNLDPEAGMRNLVVVIHDLGTPPALPLAGADE